MPQRPAVTLAPPFGTPAELLEGLTFTFERENLLAGLKVVKDPGTTIIWTAGACMILGMVIGLAGWSMPAVDSSIAASVLGLGAMIGAYIESSGGEVG